MRCVESEVCMGVRCVGSEVYKECRGVRCVGE